MKTLKCNLQKLPLSQLATFCSVIVPQWRNDYSQLRVSSSVMKTATAMSSETSVGRTNLSYPETHYREKPEHSATHIVTFL